MFDVLIIGYGSIGQKHAEILQKRNDINKIYIITKQKIKKYTTYKNISEAKSINPSYIIIANNTNQHLRTVRYIDQHFRDKIVLIEKPLFSKYSSVKVKNNHYLVGYNLRFHPIIEKIKKLIENKSIKFADISCVSYLPSWRKNIPYHLSSSAKKRSGGGVILDLSHEIDYALYLFKNINPKIAISKKLSDLRIDTDDFLSMIGSFNHNKEKSFLHIHLNYFARKPKREIVLYGSDFYLKADFIENNLEYKIKDKIKIIRFSKNSINNTYKEMLLGYSESESKLESQEEAIQFIKQKLDSAQWFIDAIKQRHQTLSLTINAILEFQKEYFITGDEKKLKPMILRDIADKINMDISTISRVANSKYIETPYGTKLLKTFFSEGLKNEDGDNVSSIEIKNILEQLVSEENKKKPLTDNILSTMMKKKGYIVARRTIAKYREQLEIPVARLRKEL